MGACIHSVSHIYFSSNTWAGEKRMEDLVPENLSKVKRFHVPLSMSGFTYSCSHAHTTPLLTDRLLGGMTVLQQLLVLLLLFLLLILLLYYCSFSNPACV